MRRIQVALRPSEALEALCALRVPPRDGGMASGVSAATAVFGARFGQEVARALDAHAVALDTLGQCLDWLERRGVCSIVRSRVRTGPREPAWRVPAEIRLDVRALRSDLAAGRDDPEGRAWATAWAMREVLRHLVGSRLHACEVKVGGERTPAVEALAAYETELARLGYGPRAVPPARFAHIVRNARRDAKKADLGHGPRGGDLCGAVRNGRRSGKVADPLVKEGPREDATAGVSMRSRSTARAEGRAAVAETATVPTPPAPTAKRARKDGADVKTHGQVGAVQGDRVRRRRASGAFGGLPDDATPEDRRTGEVAGPRGLSLDAEFFLAEAGLAQWPCDAATLERARRAVVTRLHPDRAGDASATAFHRAIKGHAELVKHVFHGTETPATTEGIAETQRKASRSPVADPRGTTASETATAKHPQATPPNAGRRAHPSGPVGASPPVMGEPPCTMPPDSEAPRRAVGGTVSPSTVQAGGGAHSTIFEWPLRSVGGDTARDCTASGRTRRHAPAGPRTSRSAGSTSTG